MKPSVRFSTPFDDEDEEDTLLERGDNSHFSGSPGFRNGRSHGKTSHNPQKPFQGQTFVVYGYDETQKQNLENMIKRQGGFVSQSLSSRTTYFVVAKSKSEENSDEIEEMVRFNHHSIHIVSEEFIYDSANNVHHLRDAEVFENIGNSRRRQRRQGQMRDPDDDDDDDDDDDENDEIRRPINHKANSYSGPVNAKYSRYSRRHSLHQNNSWGPDSTSGDHSPYLSDERHSELNHSGSELERSSDTDSSEYGDNVFATNNAAKTEALKYTLNPNATNLSQDMQKERMEWQSFLASVLTGEVIKSEKRRLSGSSRQASNIAYHLWFQINTTLRRLPSNLNESRRQIDEILQEVIDFEVKPGDVPAFDQVVEILHKVDVCESLYPTRKAMMVDKALYKSQEFQCNLDALNAWLTVTRSFQTQLKILQNWTGSDDLEITRPKDAPADAENPSFLERILKENSLKQTFEKRTLSTLTSLLLKAKRVMIENAEIFEKMKLSPYIDELPLLLNFPTKLMKECMIFLLEYVNILNDPTSMMIQQMMDDFQISLSLACKIKHQYFELVKPAEGWTIPSSIDENYDVVLLESLRFYFKLLQLKVKSGFKTVFFKEAEILDSEWAFLSGICRHIAGGEIETAAQFCMLTNKLLQSIMTNFDSELENVPNDVDCANKSKVYNKILDSVRLRSRKLLRFTRFVLGELENAAEYHIDDMNYPSFIEGLERTNHVLVYPDTFDDDGVCFIVEPSLHDRPEQIQKLLKSVLASFDKRPDDDCELKSLEYVIILSPRVTFEWNGLVMVVSMEKFNLDLKTHHTRLVADGAYRLQACKQRFRKSVDDCSIKILTETRPNVSDVNHETTKIKKTIFKLVNKIIDSVNTIQNRTMNGECQDLIENCFSFATEIGQRSLRYIHREAWRSQLNIKLTRMSIDWVSFICDDCVPTDRKTFRWAVIALEFAMATNRGNNILSLSESEFAMLRSKVGMCMRLFISHVDIMGARQSYEAQEQQRQGAIGNAEGQSIVQQVKKYRGQIHNGECVNATQEGLIAAIHQLEFKRAQKEQEQRLVGKVLEEDPQNRPLVFLASSSSNISLRWQQGKFIGGGTFGSVYLAVNLDTGDLMAVKEIRFHDPTSLNKLYKQVKDEMSVMEVLDHPNIVSYYGIEVHRDRVYIFMEYCSGGSLASQLEHGRIESEKVVQFYAYQMLAGLVYLHKNNIVHRDIKPDNILLDHTGIIKFVDFGAAKILAKNQRTMGRTTTGGGTNVNSLTGTPMYMAPEVITGGEKGRKGSMDIWSLGCCVLEMATGRRPWSNLDNEWAVMYHVVTGHPPLPDPSQLSELGIDFLKQCFTRSPQLRPSAEELLQHPWVDVE
ncbi:MAP kinase kinase kinase wis4 [Gigaspora margarita]|uniref:MAP kinase kinase kinase wis4 n=1 Tax=Gigaspora margarita TaxID=4874 RepID=A0A8H4A9D7_GIGMA|nr:MAP kinase kinase kinase wis4 [Gigaspora margarita]